MKTRQSSKLWLALACGLLAFAISTSAGKPPKPPPTPTGPAYRIVSLGIGGVAINEAGWVAGGNAVVIPEASPNGPVYFRDTSPADGVNDLIHVLPSLSSTQGAEAAAINDAGWVGGASTMDDGSWPYLRPTIWVGNTPIDLSYVTNEDTSASGINNSGLVVIGPLTYSECDAPSYVVVPKDNNNDGVPDSWFEDTNGDGFNDLLKLIAPASGIFEPSALNDTGQVILNPWTGSGCLLTPDFADADGDGNPWFADTNGDGFNDLMVVLIGLGGAHSYATGINAAGQVVGNSGGSWGGRAVLWNFVGGTQTVTDLGVLSKSMPSMGASAINDSGQIVGTARGRNDRTSFLFQNGKMYDLAALLVNGAGWTWLTAYDLNNQGIIAGTGLLNGVWQGFVAIPVTQP